MSALENIVNAALFPISLLQSLLQNTERKQGAYVAGKTRHLHYRNGRYYARMGVPAELRPVVGKRELLEALGADRTVALRKHSGAVARMQSLLDEARRQTAQAKQRTTPRRGKPLTIQQIALAHYNSQIAFDDELRNSDSRFASMGFPDEHYIADLERIQRGGATDDEVQKTIGRIIAKFAREGHTSASAGTPEWRELARALATAELESIDRMMERDDNDFNGTPRHPILIEAPAPTQLTPVGSSSRVIGPDSVKPLSEIVLQFLAEKKPKPGTANEYQVAVRMFEEFLEEARPAHAITRQDVLAYKRALIETPANYVMRFPGATLPEAIRLNKARAKPFEPLTATTINDKWLSRLRSLLGWCSDNEVIPDNPASGVKVDAAKAVERPRIPFTPSDLTRIFAPPLFALGKPLGEFHWALLIALHQGFRASEIAQIRLDSIRHERGVLVFAIEEETKNLASVRLVPVHSTLLRLGLSEHISTLRKAGKDRLFPDWFAKGQAAKLKADEVARTVNQTFSQFIPRKFNRTYLPSIGIVDDRKVFHSFRHTLKTALAIAGVSREISDNITGHDDSSAAAGYIHAVSIEEMKAALEMVHFDGLDLQDLFESTSRRIQAHAA